MIEHTYTQPIATHALEGTCTGWGGRLGEEMGRAAERRACLVVSRQRAQNLWWAGGMFEDQERPWTS